MLVCLECHRTFDEDEIKCWQEDRGECFGFPAYETVSGCPYCNGAYTETYRCDECGEWIDTDKYVEVGDKKYCENCFIVQELENI